MNAESILQLTAIHYHYNHNVDFNREWPEISWSARAIKTDWQTQRWTAKVDIQGRFLWIAEQIAFACIIRFFYFKIQTLNSGLSLRRSRYLAPV